MATSPAVRHAEALAEQLALIPKPPSGPQCEKCAGPTDPDEAAAGFTRCRTCDPDGRHTAWAVGGPCELCTAVRAELAALGCTFATCGAGMFLTLTSGRPDG